MTYAKWWERQTIPGKIYSLESAHGGDVVSHSGVNGQRKEWQKRLGNVPRFDPRLLTGPQKTKKDIM
jgi:hypothetical protein